MVFYYHMIYTPETDKQISHCSRLQSLRLQQINTYNDTYSVHDNVLMWCRGRLLCLLASCECLPASTTGYQLLISSPPPRRAGSPSLPRIHGGPISPRVHAHSCSFVCYSYCTREYWITSGDISRDFKFKIIKKLAKEKTKRFLQTL
jgi:hypothetical protein